MKWLTKEKYCRDTGLSIDKLHKLKKDVLENGHHYKVIGQDTWINVIAMDERLDTLVSDTMKVDAKSPTPTPSPGSGGRSSQPTPIRKLD